MVILDQTNDLMFIAQQTPVDLLSRSGTVAGELVAGRSNMSTKYRIYCTRTLLLRCL